MYVPFPPSPSPPVGLGRADGSAAAKIHIGPWAKDRALKELGRFELVNMQMSVDSHTLALFTRVLNYSADQVRVTMEWVKREFRNRDLRLMTSYRFIAGRKPGLAAPASGQPTT